MHSTRVADRATPSAQQPAAESRAHSGITDPGWRTRGFTRGDSAVWLGLATLLALWCWKLWSTWAAWGDLSIDSGHEMYVPWMLSRGRTLYRDVWFMYPPAGPYINAILFRVFSARLEVLYWAGSLSALGSAVFLFLSGVTLNARLAGWTAGAVVLLEAFQPTLFCFPLPYSFSTVYACLAGCAFLWFVLNAWSSDAWGWLFAAGCAAALAFLLKTEFGTAGYATLALLAAAKCYARKSWRPAGPAALALLPGVLCCAGVFAWMFSIAGVEFIIRENIMSWPGSYFMRTYGALWLKSTGFTVSPTAFADAFSRAIPLLGLVALICSLRWWKRSDSTARALRIALALAIPVLLLVSRYDLTRPVAKNAQQALAALFFPQDAALYVSVAAVVAWWRFLRGGGRLAGPLALLFSYTALLSFRILMGMDAEYYSVFYNGPVVLSYLVLMFLLIAPAQPTVGATSEPAELEPGGLGGPRVVAAMRALFAAGCLAAVFLGAHWREVWAAQNYVPLATERGTIRATALKVQNYRAAIRLMQQKAAAGESVLSVPEDTSLYFLAGVECPTRVYVFAPGVLVPGRMVDETIRQIEAHNVTALIWSNRLFLEYEKPVFGVNFDVPLGDYLRAHFHPVGRLVSTRPPLDEWTAVVWERVSPPAADVLAPGGAANPAGEAVKQ